MRQNVHTQSLALCNTYLFYQQRNAKHLGHHESPSLGRHHTESIFAQSGAHESTMSTTKNNHKLRNRHQAVGAKKTNATFLQAQNTTTPLVMCHGGAIASSQAPPNGPLKKVEGWRRLDKDGG